MMMGPGDNDHEADGFEEGAEDAYETHEAEDHEELSLTDDDEPLPWLETADYDTEEEGNDTARMIGFALLALALLAALIAAIWYFSNRGSDPELAPDGSTIEAPEGDYKERPENAGGSEVEGTGDRSFEVGEGEGSEGRLGGSGSADGAGTASGDEARPSVGTRSSTEGAASGSSSSGDGVGVQVAAYSTKAGADAGWGKIRSQTQALNGFKYRVVQAQVDGSTVYRLQAVAANAAAADKLCAALKADGVACQVKR